MPTHPSSALFWALELLLAVAVTLSAGGPAAAGLNTWTTGGPVGSPGGTFAHGLAVDPQSPASVYVSTFGGGIFKSTDGGQSWTAMNSGLEHAFNHPEALFPLTVVVDPVTPSTVYAGMNAGVALTGGVFKSTDGGNNWTRMNNGLPAGQQFGIGVQALVIDPVTPTTLYTGPSNFGVYKSIDGGATWTPMNNGIPPNTAVLVLTIDPHTPDTVYAGIISSSINHTVPEGMFRSTDGGSTWVPKNSGVPAAEFAVPDLAIDPQTPSILYRSTSGNSTVPKVYRSLNRCDSWDVMSNGLPGGLGRVNSLAIDPQSPSTLYAATSSNGVFRSTNGGGSWAEMNDGLPSPNPPFIASIGALAISPSGACLHGASAVVYDFSTGADPCNALPPPPGLTGLVAAVLPSSRSVRVNSTATAFVTIINTGANPAVQVGIALGSAIPATLNYQMTSCATNAITGGLNVAATIPVGGMQCYVIAVTPTAPFAPQEVPFNFAGTNTTPVTVLVGINTLLLSGNTTPTADVVAVAVTLGGNGILDIPGPTGTGAFAVAVSNVGITDTVTMVADTGAAALGVGIAICETDLVGNCKAPPAPSVTTTILGVIDSGVIGTATYGVFVTGSGVIAFDPAANRIFVRYLDPANATRGATSVAVRTQ